MKMKLPKTITTQPPKKGKRIVGSINPLLLEPQPDTSSPMPDGIHGPASMGSSFAPAAGDGGGCGDCGGGMMEEASVEKESSIDYPKSSGLCPEIWDEVKEGEFKIKADIKQKALELVDMLLAKYHVEAKGVNVVGSICSNQYTEDADVDVHIQVDLTQEVADALNGLRKLEQDGLFADVDLMVGGGTHPLEFYFQPNIYGDMGSCGCYDLMKDEWLSGPDIVDLEFDPYEEYDSAVDAAFEFGKKVQDALFELRADLFKRNAILNQASYEDIYTDEQMMSVIGRRLEETNDKILDDMKVVAELKEEMVKVRKSSGVNPKNEKEAEEMRTNKEWLIANSTFKFLQRLDVLDSCWAISELWKSYDSGTMDSVEVIETLNGGF